MTLRKKITALLFIAALGIYSCNDNKKSTTALTDNNTIEGNEQFLENDGIQLLLPKGFERISSAKYESILRDVKKGKALDIEQKRLSHLRKIDGNNYIFFDEKSKSSILVNTLPQEPILKEDAKTILADIVRDQAEISKVTKQKFSKISASYNESGFTQVFKSVFKVTDKQNKIPEYFEHKYYISTKDNYMIIDMTTPLEIDFDKYLTKIKM